VEDRHRFRKWTDKMVGASQPSDLIFAIPAL
jgi:hypothetical protein